MRPVHLLLLGALLAPVAHGDSTAEEVDYLIRYVEHSGCTYTRNGTDHDSADAADHLRLKYNRGKRYVGNAEQFIDRLASESSWTGKAYSITCDGVTEPSGAWLHRALDDYRDNRGQTPASEAAE